MSAFPEACELQVFSDELDSAGAHSELQVFSDELNTAGDHDMGLQVFSDYPEAEKNAAGVEPDFQGYQDENALQPPPVARSAIPARSAAPMGGFEIFRDDEFDTQNVSNQILELHESVVQQQQVTK